MWGRRRANTPLKELLKSLCAHRWDVCFKYSCARVQVVCLLKWKDAVVSFIFRPIYNQVLLFQTLSIVGTLYIRQGAVLFSEPMSVSQTITNNVDSGEVMILFVFRNRSKQCRPWWSLWTEILSSWIRHFCCLTTVVFLLLFLLWVHISHTAQQRPPRFVVVLLFLVCLCMHT